VIANRRCTIGLVARFLQSATTIGGKHRACFRRFRVEINPPYLHELHLVRYGFMAVCFRKTECSKLTMRLLPKHERLQSGVGW